MDGLRNPVGKEPPEVYWKRRLVLGVGILIVILIVWALVATNSSGDPAPGTASGSTTDSTVSPAPDASDAAGSAARACGPDDVTITTTANPADVSPGALPVFDLGLAHKGASACMFDTSADGTELLITSGSDRIYSSTDCPDDGTIAAKQLILEPGANESLSITWNGQRSLPKCATVTSEPQPGTYNAAVTIQGISSEAAVFRLE